MYVCSAVYLSVYLSVSPVPAVVASVEQTEDTLAQLTVAHFGVRNPNGCDATGLRGDLLAEQVHGFRDISVPLLLLFRCPTVSQTNIPHTLIT